MARCRSFPAETATLNAGRLKSVGGVRPLTACVLAATATTIWGTPPVVARAVSGDLPPVALAFWRWFIAALIMVPLVGGALRAEWPRLRPHLPSLVLVAAFTAAGSSLSIVAVYFTTATNAVLVNAIQPAVTALVAWVVTRESLTRRQGVGVACAFLGILVMVARADPRVLATLDINVGDPIMLLAVFAWSLYAVYLHRREFLPSGDILMFVISVVGAAMLVPLYAAEALLAGTFTPTPALGGAILYLALIPTLFATHCWNNALGVLGPNRAAIFINIIPISGATFAMLILGERLYSYHFIGAAFVFCGIWLAVRRQRLPSGGAGAEESSSR